MHRHRRVASVLVAILLAAALAPTAGPDPAAAAGPCGTYRSETVPPATIRVFRTASGAVDTVDFRTYVKNVLSREWISSWTTESLRSGALAVKSYAWYQVLHWRGYVNAAGHCFDVFDSTRDQHYDPGRPTYPSMAAAVDATWGTLAHRGGGIFATYYNAGSAGEACGANANGWQMFQWGTQACGLAGRSAAQILAIYYPGVTVSSAPAAATPPPVTPAPTASPTSTPTPTPTAPPGTAPPAAPTPPPTPAFTPAPPPAPPVTPGGGQVGLSAPPSPPPPNPAPIVVSVGETTAAPALAATAAGRPPRAATMDLARFASHAALRFERLADENARAAPAAPRPTPRLAIRQFLLRLIVDRALSTLPYRSGLGR